MSSEETWTPLLTEDGSWTLCAPGHGQACHSRTGAWGESMVRFAQGCRLRERVEEEGLTRLRVLDERVLFSGFLWDQTIQDVRYDFDYDQANDRFLILRPIGDDPGRQIHVVLNWFEELKERVPVD